MNLGLWFILVIICIGHENHDVKAQGSGGMTMNEKQKMYLDLFKPRGAQTQASLSKSKMTDLSKISTLCAKNAFYNSFNRNHIKAVARVKAIIQESGSIAEKLKMALTLRDRPEINFRVWLYAVTSFVYTDTDLQGIRKVRPWEIVPDAYFPLEVLDGVKRSRQSNGNGQCSVLLDEKITADNGIENVLWYFRQDVILNAHHWYWHAVYVPEPPVKLDRAGELFYYFHHGALARYNADRFSNGLLRTKEFQMSDGGIMEEGYNAHLRDDISGFNWTPRQAFTPLSDVNRPAGNRRDDLVNTTVMDLVVGRNRILSAIQKETLEAILSQVFTVKGYLQRISQHMQGEIQANGTKIPLNNFNGIDLLSDVIVAINYSVNPDLYSISGFGIHNNGHDIIGLSSDPKYVLRLPPGVMDDVATSMRDIIFYPWHTNINNIFIRHKSMFKPYQKSQGEFPLLWEGVSVTGLKVIANGRQNPIIKNSLHTFWTYREVTLNHGLDFYRNRSAGPVKICVKHLDHEEFKYRIVINRSGPDSKATIRIFLAPRFREDGSLFRFNEQRNFFFAMDSFTTILKTGKNVITRRSADSTVTIPWEATFAELQMEDNRITPYCGCGWPYHLLLPKGTFTGMTFDLFVMVTPNDADVVSGSNPTSMNNTCQAAPVYCGLVNQKYPDTKPMGYPLDRVVSDINYGHFNLSRAKILEEFMEGITNMANIQVKIFHTGEVRS